MRRDQREAAEWAALMRGTPTDAERAAFEHWHAKPGHAEAFAAAEEDAGLDLSRTRIEALARGEKHAPGRLRWAVATVAAIGLALGAVWHVTRQADTPQIAAGPMLPGQLRLADGSIVTLLDGAWAEPQFGATERRVRLHGGRARFDVAHDAARPFIVVAGRSETQALGTVFEVDARSDTPRIRLVRGAVEVRLGGSAKGIRLTPGESAEVAAAGPLRLPAMESPVPATMLAADNLPLGAVVDAANKTGARPIRLAGPTLATLPVTGRFDISDSARLARKLAAALGLSVEERPGEIVLTKK